MVIQGLENTGLTDDGLQFLKHLSELENVSLEGPFTDAAIPYLAQTTAINVNVRKHVDLQSRATASHGGPGAEPTPPAKIAGNRRVVYHNILDFRARFVDTAVALPSGPTQSSDSDADFGVKGCGLQLPSPGRTPRSKTL